MKEQIQTALKVFFIVLNCVIVAMILKQETKERGFGSRGTALPPSYLSKNGKMTTEKKMVMATRVMIVLYAASAVAILLLGSGN